MPAFALFCHVRPASIEVVLSMHRAMSSQTVALLQACTIENGWPKFAPCYL